MNVFRNRLQSNSKIDREGGYVAGQTFNLPELKYYTEEQAWEFLRIFDLTTKRIRQNRLDHYRTRINYLSTLPNTISPITLDLLKDQIALLELTFEYTVWYQPNRNIEESQITYYTDEEN